MVLLMFWTWRPSRPASVYDTKLCSDWPRKMERWKAPGEHRLDIVMCKLGPQGNTVGEAKKWGRPFSASQDKKPIKVKLFLLKCSPHYPQRGKAWDTLGPMDLTHHVASPAQLIEHHRSTQKPPGHLCSLQFGYKLCSLPNSTSQFYVFFCSQRLKCIIR